MQDVVSSLSDFLLRLRPDLLVSLKEPERPVGRARG